MRKEEYLGRAVIYRRLGELDIGTVIGTKGNGLKIVSCTSQALHVIHDEPLLLTALEKTYDFLRGKEMPCKELVDHVELIKCKFALRASSEACASIYDIVNNAIEMHEPSEVIYLVQIMEILDNTREQRHVKDDHPF